MQAVHDFELHLEKLSEQILKECEEYINQHLRIISAESVAVLDVRSISTCLSTIYELSEESFITIVTASIQGIISSAQKMVKNSMEVRIPRAFSSSTEAMLRDSLKNSLENAWTEISYQASLINSYAKIIRDLKSKDEIDLMQLLERSSRSQIDDSNLYSYYWRQVANALSNKVRDVRKNDTSLSLLLRKELPFLSKFIEEKIIEYNGSFGPELNLLQGALRRLA